MAIKKIKAKSPDPYLGKTTGDATLARIAHVNQLVDQINNNVPTSSYKVYTALLTQNGESSDQYTSSGDLILGVTYTITINDDDLANWTNVGAPNNNIGTSFVATGTTPISWGSNSELNYNTGAPVATVLENTIGNVWWTYVYQGIYYANSNELFTENKTYCSATLSNYNYDNTNVFLGFLNNNVVRMMTLLPGDSFFNGSDTSIEIRVYN